MSHFTDYQAVLDAQAAVVLDVAGVVFPTTLPVLQPEEFSDIPGVMTPPIVLRGEVGGGSEDAVEAFAGIDMAGGAVFLCGRNHHLSSFARCCLLIAGIICWM